MLRAFGCAAFTVCEVHSPATHGERDGAVGTQQWVDIHFIYAQSRRYTSNTHVPHFKKGKGPTMPH